MKQTFRPGRFFAKAEGTPPSWKERLARMTGKAKPKAQAEAKLEIDDANGEKLIFPEIGDVSEIAEGVAVTATDGEHVFTADSTTYTVTVANGIITAVVETEVTAEEPEMNADTAEFVEAVALGLEAAEAFQATARGEIDELKSQLATALGELKDLKANMSHKTPKEGEGDDNAPKTVTVGGKKINFANINLK